MARSFGALVLAVLFCRCLAVVDENERTGATLGDQQLGDVVPAGRTFLLLHLLKQKLLKLQALDKITTPMPFSNCICVPFYLCDANRTIITDGTGVIDLR